VHYGETRNCEAMCGSIAGPQHHFHLLLHSLPRHYAVLQVRRKFTLRSVWRDCFTSSNKTVF
jgi:hypothetical protein